MSNTNRDMTGVEAYYAGLTEGRYGSANRTSEFEDRKAWELAEQYACGYEDARREKEDQIARRLRDIAEREADKVRVLGWA